MYQDFRVIGASYLTSSIEVREKLALSESECGLLSTRLQELFNFEDLLVLSTCNRTEIYYSAEEDLADQIITTICFYKRLESDQWKSNFVSRSGKDAVNHLFKVTLGLDAKVLGDLQITNQVKKAYQQAADLHSAGPFLHRLMHSIFFANKRVIQETIFKDGVASTSYASVELAKYFVKNFSEPKVLVLGLGEIGHDVAENLVNSGWDISIASRDHNKTLVRAEELGFSPMTMENALDNLQQYNVVISSLAVAEPIVNSDLFYHESVVHRLLVDLSVPRSMTPDLDGYKGNVLYNIDQIEEKTSSTLRKREKAVPKVEKIIEESLHDLENWAQEMEVSPTIKKLKEALESIRKEEVGRFLRKSDKADSELIEKITKSIIQKVIKLPVIELKAACKRGEADGLVEVLHDLFDLEKQNVKPDKS